MFEISDSGKLHERGCMRRLPMLWDGFHRFVEDIFMQTCIRDCEASQQCCPNHNILHASVRSDFHRLNFIHFCTITHIRRIIDTFRRELYSNISRGTEAQPGDTSAATTHDLPPSPSSSSSASAAVAASSSSAATVPPSIS